MPLDTPPSQFHPRPRVCVCWRMGGGQEDRREALPSAPLELWGLPLPPRPTSGCHSLSNKQSLSVSPSLPPARVLPLRSVSVHPLTPSVSSAHLPSPARLACSPSFSHSLSLLVTLCLFFSSPFVSRTCPCSPSQAPFLSSLPSSTLLLVSFLSLVRSWHPPPHSNLPVPINLA